MTFNDHMICKAHLYGMLPLIVDCGKKKCNSCKYVIYDRMCAYKFKNKTDLQLN